MTEREREEKAAGEGVQSGECGRTNALVIAIRLTATTVTLSLPLLSWFA